MRISDWSSDVCSSDLEAARIEGCGWLGILWRVYVPLARPTYLAYALVSVSTHWNNFLWPLIVTNPPETRPLTVGLSIFGAPESGFDISVISAAKMMSMAPLLIAFLVFQRPFVQALLRTGIKVRKGCGKGRGVAVGGTFVRA